MAKNQVEGAIVRIVADNSQNGRGDGGGGGPGDTMPPMDHAERIATLEAIVPTLAKGTDLAELRTDMNKGFAELVKWIVGTGLVLGGTGITVMTFVLNNATPKAPAAQPQPVVIMLPAPAASR